MSKWQPIETAPRDGTPILGYSRRLPPKARIGTIMWVEPHWQVGGSEWAGGALAMWMSDPTHWMPLPEPPV